MRSILVRGFVVFAALFISVACPEARAGTTATPGPEMAHPAGELPSFLLWSRPLDLTGGIVGYEQKITDVHFTVSLTAVFTQNGPADEHYDGRTGERWWTFPANLDFIYQWGDLPPSVERVAGGDVTDHEPSANKKTWILSSEVEWHEDNTDGAAARFKETDIVDLAAGATVTKQDLAGDAAHAAIIDMLTNKHVEYRLTPTDIKRQTIFHQQYSAVGDLIAQDEARPFSGISYSNLPFDDIDSPVAKLDKTTNETAPTLRKVQYKFTIGTNPPEWLTWAEVYTRKGSTGPTDYNFLSWQPANGETESPVYTIDPLGLDPGDASTTKRRPNEDGSYSVAVIQAELAVDANRDGEIKFRDENTSDATTGSVPYRFWINDDNDTGSGGTAPDYADNVVNGWNDLKKDFFPVFLDIKQLLNALPPSSGATYKLKQADGALNFVYTDLTRATAFRFKDGYTTELFTAPTTQITAAGVALSTTFLNSVKDGDQGVLLMEGRAVTNQPLVLVVEKDGAVVAQTSLYVSIAPNILLLLHGMNSNTDTWDTFVGSSQTFYVGGSGIISDGAIQSTPSINYNGVRCYRLQFGAYDMASTRTGVEGVSAANTPGYNTVGTRCGDFETFDQLGQEVEDAITLLLARHPGARIILAGHSRGGLSARAFLEKPGSSAAKAAVISMLTTSSPNLGSRMGRIYGWLNTHQRGTPQGYTDDWQVVDFLIQPTAYGQPKTVLDVRRPVILDVADNSLAIANLNAQTAVQNLPANVRYGEIQYADANFGLLTVTPVRYSVLEHTGAGGVLFPQLSNAAADFLLSGGAPGDVQFIGDGLIPQANQRFTQLAGFPGIAVSPRVVTDQEIVHIGAPSQIADLLAQLKQLAPELFP